MIRLKIHTCQQQLLLTLFLLVTFITAINANSQRSPTLCGAMDESSEERCKTSTGPLAANPDFKVKYLLYKNPENVDEYEEIFIENKESIIDANPFPNGTTWKILVHGFTNDKNSQFPVNVKKAYLEHLCHHPDEPINLLVFDWGDGAKRDWSSILKHKGIYQNAVENVQLAGEKLGDMVVYLQQEGFLDIATGVHLIGHSLGAHVVGQAARRIYNQTGTLTFRVTGLDPAGPLFWKNALLFWLHDPYPRLHRNRARFLDVYHTSKRYGSKDAMGDVDFFINGGRKQPSCRGWTYIDRQTCSHQFAPEIFAKSINNKTMRACTGCYSYEEYHNGKCECEDRPILGEYVEEENLDGYPYASGVAFYDIDKLWEESVSIKNCTRI